MRCHGLSPTTAGRCGPPATEEQRCGGSADTLATYTRQNDADARHPECKGYCNRTKCAPLVELDGACTIAAACGTGKMCVAGKCANATPGKVGETCPGGECEKGAICVKGKCAARKAAGEKCETDYECIAGCVKKSEAGTSGVCGKKCGVR
jgi:peptidoglycan-associated lipoprotein